MLTVSVVSLKGGVGKTTVTVGLAGAAQARGMRTVVVDLDPQANATTALAPARVEFTANDVLSDTNGLSTVDAATASGWGTEVAVVAGDPALMQRDRPEDGGGEHRLRKALTTLDGYHIGFVDCPPSLGQLTRSALAASDLALVITEPTIFALTATTQVLDAVDDVRQRFNLRLRPAGIVVNRVRARSAEHRFRIDELLAAYRGLVLDPVLPDRSVVSRAQGSGVPVQRWPSPGAREISRVFAGYLDHLIAVAGTSAGPWPKGTR